MPEDGNTQGGNGGNQPGNQGSSGSSGGNGSNNPPKPPALPLYGIILIVLAAIILIVVVIILIVYIRRRQRRQTGDVEKKRGKHIKKEKHGGKGHRHHEKPNEKSKIVNPISKGEEKKKIIKDERFVHNQPPPDKRVAREKSPPAVPRDKKPVRPAQPVPAPSANSYMDMTQQSRKQPTALPTYDNRPSNQNVYDELEPVNSYEGLQSEYLEPTPHGGDTYQGLNSSDRRDYVNEETGSYLELEPPGYEDPVPSAQLTAHYVDLN